MAKTFTTSDCLNTPQAQVELPGLEVIAQLKFDLAYRELSPSLQRFVRDEAARRAALDLLDVVESAIAFIGQTQEYKTGHTGAGNIVRQGRAAIDLARGK